MITIRRGHERGHANHGWLDTYHSFSFANYYDPEHMGFRTLRVINEDRVTPGAGFGMHPHRDMEIITYILAGQLEHRDSMGNGAVITPGQVQRMSAGTGVRHSEYNPSQSEPVHLIQIWILPDQRNLTPEYEQTEVPADFTGGLFPIAAPDGANGVTRIHQDVTLSVGRHADGDRFTLALAPGRAGWLQVTRGKTQAGAHAFQAGDAAAVENESQIELSALQDCEYLWFDLA